MHPTEERFPEQCEEFRRIVDSLYIIHLGKNLDYSPHNVLATGEVGLLTRIWDKTARLMNLGGFDIGTGEYGAKKEPRNESIDDTLTDLANYAIIMKIVRQRKWGK